MDDKELANKIKNANTDWTERTMTEAWDVQYDSDADILYASCGGPTKAFSIPADEPNDGVYLRVNVETYRVVGFDISDFLHVFMKSNLEIKQAFDQLFGVLGYGDWRFQISSPCDDEGGEEMSEPAAYVARSYFSTYIPKIAPDLVPA